MIITARISQLITQHLPPALAEVAVLLLTAALVSSAVAAAAAPAEASSPVQPLAAVAAVAAAVLLLAPLCSRSLCCQLLPKRPTGSDLARAARSHLLSIILCTCRSFELCCRCCCCCLAIASGTSGGGCCSSSLICLRTASSPHTPIASAGVCP
jgi:hypothetical protein